MHENSTQGRRRMPAAGRGLAALAAGAACAAGLAAGSPAQAATLTNAQLSAVSADSASDAWAVGNGDNATASEEQSLILHWNGTKWAAVASPNPGGTGGTFLNGEAAVSPTDVWAVGFAGTTALILRWNGTSWAKVATPTLPGASGVNWVSADSATDAWAVGYENGIGGASVLLHWNGTKWSQVAIPSGVTLNQVKAISPTDVWAGGLYQANGSSGPAVLHWNGTSWTQVTLAVPSGATSGNVVGIGASSATNAWGVGTYLTSNDETGLDSWHLKGSTWSQVAVPNNSPMSVPDQALSGVDTLSATSAWTVGFYTAANQAVAPLVLRWNGTAWQQAATLIPAKGDLRHLSAVDSQSASNAWAVGVYDDTATSGKSGTYILHWNGTSWTRVKSPN
jgi:hypothetical protein